MQITEIRVKIMEEQGERLQGFCSITLDDCFVVRDLKIIEGVSGPFVAMPSRKLTAHCPRCGCKNHLRAGFCNQCGEKLRADRTVKDEDGRSKLYADIAHPINSQCREMIQDRVIAAFREELVRSKQPGYVSNYDDFDEDPPPKRHVERRADPPSAITPPAARPSVSQAAHPPKRVNGSATDELRSQSSGVTSYSAANNGNGGPHKPPSQGANSQGIPAQSTGDRPATSKTEKFGAGIL